MDTPIPSPYREGLPPQPPGPPEGEQHLAVPDPVRGLVSGATEGPILPFAVATGLAGAGAEAPLIALAGLVALAGAVVASAFGDYLALRGEARRYAVERAREERETQDYPDREKWEVSAILHRYGLRGETLHRATEAIAADRRRWVDFMMRFELDLKEPDAERAAASAAATGAAHAAGGLVPLLPYFLLDATGPALALSAAATGAALFGLGWLRARTSGLPPLNGALQRMAVALAAAAVAWLVATIPTG